MNKNARFSTNIQMNDLNSSVVDVLDTALRPLRYQIVDQRENHLAFKCNELDFQISYNVLEYSYSLFLIYKRESIEIDNYLLGHFFNSELRFDYVSLELFLDNLSSFFQNYGLELLTDSSKLKALIAFFRKTIEEYNKSLMLNQNLTIADKAWRDKDFTKFIKCMGKIHLHDLPQSYALKYKIAMSKM